MWEPRSLEKIRLCELERVIPYFPGDARILEIGAGNGWQARALAERGYEIKAIDYAHKDFEVMRQNRVFSVQDYDGYNIPYPNQSFDVVFSSNVLEHIPHVESFQAEIRRILKPQGIAVHILPTSTWRLWTTVTHYLFLLGKVFGKRWKKKGEQESISQLSKRVLYCEGKSSIWNRIRWWLTPERHGEKGNFVTEVYYFSRWRWRTLFKKTGFRILNEAPSRLFYSGFGLFATSLSLRDRQRMSRILGSSCRAYILAGDNTGAGYEG